MYDVCVLCFCILCKIFFLVRAYVTFTKISCWLSSALCIHEWSRTRDKSENKARLPVNNDARDPCLAKCCEMKRSLTPTAAAAAASTVMEYACLSALRTGWKP